MSIVFYKTAYATLFSSRKLNLYLRATKWSNEKFPLISHKLPTKWKNSLLGSTDQNKLIYSQALNRVIRVASPQNFHGPVCEYFTSSNFCHFNGTNIIYPNEKIE